MMAEELLRVENLKKYFVTNSGLLHAVDDVSFSLGKGKTLGVVGESGCGKSTLGRTILRLHEPTSGKIFFKGQDITDLDKKAMKELRRNMQIIFQDPFASLNPRMTVAQTIQESLLIQGIFTKKDKAGLEKRVRELMELCIGVLAGIPSVVYGLVGMTILVPGIRILFGVPDGATLFAAIIVLAVMILPSVINVSLTALQAVPQEYEEASLALGATGTETYFRVTVPAAKSGIFTAIVLGIGRAIGEAMAIMMVAGNVANMPSLFKSVRFLTTAVASEMSYSSGLQREALFSIALVLFLFIMIINAILNVLKTGGKAE